MKLPSSLAMCFGGCAQPPSETESSNFSVWKGPGPSGNVLGGFLSSFMSRRSCSRATWDYSATDVQKPRVRTRADADVVTLATARYLELFAASPKNEETSTVLSENQEAQDFMRSARTASENQVSRSSTFTGRTSRELSRLATGSNPAPHLAQLASLVTSNSQRVVPLPSHRRGASDASNAPSSSSRDAAHPPPAQGGQPAPPPAYARNRTSSMPHISALSPFTNKTRISALFGNRCRSDRVSPSTATYLLPAPSAKSIARAHTSLPVTAAACGAITTSTSFNDLSGGAPVESGTADSGGPTTVAVRALESHSVSATQTPTAGAAVSGISWRSRLQTESGGVAAASVASGAAAVASPPAAAAAAVPSDLGVAAQQWVQNHNQLTRSSTVLWERGTVRRALPRRPSILFTRDGDVTVTGLPPSCLTAGRAPRCRMDGPGAMFPTGPGSTSVTDMSVPIMCPLLIAGRSVDSSSSRNGVTGEGVAFSSSRASGVHEPISLTMLNRSNDRSTYRGNATAEVGLSAAKMRQLHQRRHGVGGGVYGGGGGQAGLTACVSMSCGANAVFTTVDVSTDGRAMRACNSNAQLEGFLEVEQEQQNHQQQQQHNHQQEQQQQREQIQRQEPQKQDGEHEGEGEVAQVQSAQQGHERLQQGQQGHQQEVPRQCGVIDQEGNQVAGPQILALADSSSEGQRCDWGGSSMYAPSRFSDSSRLTHGNTTGVVTVAAATASTHSNNPLEPCGVVGSATGATSNIPSGLPGRLASVSFSEGSPAGQTAGAVKAVATAVTAVAAVTTATTDVGGDRVSQVGGGPKPIMPAAGPVMQPYGSSAAATSPSLLATEARDVTSALNRLQEACLAAVAQGDMRSQRLCRRVSTELPRVGMDPSQLLMCIGGGGGRTLAVRTQGIRTGPGFGPSTLLPRIMTDDINSNANTNTNVDADTSINTGINPSLQPQGRGGDAPSHAGSVTLAVNLTLQGSNPSGACGPEVSAACGLWAIDGFSGERASPEVEGIIIDGAVLKRGICSTTDHYDDDDHHHHDDDGNDGFGKGEQQNWQQPGGMMAFDDDGPCMFQKQRSQIDVADIFDDAGDEFRNRMLNVLLRSDFLHDTHEAPSEDEDDGVVEYRYGGFELGGGDHDWGLTRQASFMEAVRKCGTAKAAASAVGLDPSYAGACTQGLEAGALFQSATLARAAMSNSRHGPTGTAVLQRKGSCLAVSAVG